MMNPFRSLRTTAGVYAALLLAVIAACLFLLFLNTPPQNDDFYFAIVLNATPDASAFNYTFEASSWLNMLSPDQNTRLANLLIPAFLYLPHWVFATVMTLCTLYMLVGGLRLAGVRASTSPRALSFMVAVMMLVWPWKEWMFTIAFATNYVVSGALMVWYLRLFLRERPNVVLGVLAALLAGFIHEGVALGLLCASVWMLMVNGTCRTWRHAAMTVLLVPGLAWILSSAANQSRMHESFEGGTFTYRRAIAPVVFVMLGLWTAVQLVAIVGRKPLRQLLNFARSGFGMMFVVALVTLTVYLTYPIGYRQGAWATLLGTVGIIGAVRSRQWMRRVAATRVVHWCAYLAVAVTIVHMAASAAASFYLPEAFRAVVDQTRQAVAKGRSEVHLPDKYYQPQGIQALTLNKVAFPSHYEGNRVTCWFVEAVTGRHVEDFHIIPESVCEGLSRFSEPLEGYPGTYLWGRYLIVEKGVEPLPMYRVGVGPVDLDVAFFKRDYRDADGRRLVLLEANSSPLLIDAFGMSNPHQGR